MSELKPCPFCGGEYVRCRWNYMGDGFKYREIHCNDCGATLTKYSEYIEDDIELCILWNIRAEQTCTVTPDFNCSNCGKQIGVVRNWEMCETCDGRQTWKSLDHEVCDVPNYCPNCGAKVVEQ